jgi:hypothetical protein
MARQQTQGTCYLCKGTFPKASMTRHLTKCLAAHDPAEGAAKAKAKKGKLVRVVVEAKGDPRYWLHLEMPATARLRDLDQFLRDIWLECCGHLSAFKVEGKKRSAPHSLANLMSADPMDWRDPDEVDMEEQVGEVLRKGSKLSYDYDFGSTTCLSLKGVDEREGLVVKPHEVRLLARNDPPHIPCGKCHAAPAAVIDMENSYDESGWLCERCAEEEGVSIEEFSLPVVNSPRTGVCGYTGN